MTTTPPSREHPMASEQVSLATVMAEIEEWRNQDNPFPSPPYTESNSQAMRTVYVDVLDAVLYLLTALRDAIRARHAEHVRHLPETWTDSVASDMAPTVRNARATELAWVLGNGQKEK